MTAQEVRHLTIDLASGHWVDGFPITHEEACVVAASVLPGKTPEQVSAWYGPGSSPTETAWDEGFSAGWAEHADSGPFVNDVWDAKTPNPYREEKS